jgi:xylan 1,4-beta-xylosidase
MQSRRTVLKKIAAGSGAVSLVPLTVEAHSDAARPRRQTSVQLHLNKETGPLRIDHFGVGHGGYWDQPTWLDRARGEVRALNSKVIRLFVQEYYNLLPTPDRYNWEHLDSSVSMILNTGSEPLMCLTFKPRMLFPRLDQDVVFPTDWAAWERLVYELVRHYKERGTAIQYWEIGNEGDIGAAGGCPYRFTPETYKVYYQHTARAIRHADPEACVGGPALARHTSPILPALLSFCERGGAPLDFVSWHNYSSDPDTFTQSIRYVKALLSNHPSLHAKTILDEWNTSIGNPPPDPRFQPCFIAEVIWRMVEAGLDYANYYQIRDYYVDPRVMSFLPWWNPADWNRTSLKLGLFDFQNVVRPAYYLFRLLSRLTGNRIEVECPDSSVHGLASYDDALRVYSLLVWNFSDSAVQVALRVPARSFDLHLKPVTLDSSTPSNEEFHRLRREPKLYLDRSRAQIPVSLEPYGVSFLAFAKQG